MGLIYLDTCLLIYALEDHPRFGLPVRQRLAQVAPERLAISPLVHLECMVGPMKSGNLLLQQRYEEGLRRLVCLPLPEPVYLLAARLRAQFGLRTPDAIHLAAAQFHRADELWTHDDRLAAAGGGLALNVLQPDT